MVYLVLVIQRLFLFLRYVIVTRINNNKGVVTKIPSKPKLSSTNQGKNSILEEDINSSSTRENNCTSNNLTLMFLRFMVLSSSQKCIFRLYDDRWFTSVSILLF